jgi:hypothetical protein
MRISRWSDCREVDEFDGTQSPTIQVGDSDWVRRPPAWHQRNGLSYRAQLRRCRIRGNGPQMQSPCSVGSVPMMYASLPLPSQPGSLECTVIN